jgi:hypothetical protein
MKKNILKLSAVLLCGALAFTSCKKKSDANPDDSGAQTTTAQDQTDYARETNQTATDVDATLSSTGSDNARLASAPPQIITGGTVDYTKASSGIYTITYADTTTAGTVRKGSVSITVSPSGAKWDSAGTMVIITSSYVVTKANGKTMGIEGVDTLTKVTSGDYSKLIAAGSGQYQVSHTGVDTVTFDNGTTRKWQHSRLRTFSYNSPTLTVSVAGSGNADGLTDVDTWGINRAGEAFYSEIKTPIEWIFNPSAPRSTCSHWFDPVSGVYFHKGVGAGLTVTYGVSITGGTPLITDCPYGFELQWTFNGKQEKAILPY